MSDLSTITPSNWFGEYSEDFLSAWLEKFEGRLGEYFDLPQGLAFGETSDGTRVLYEVASGTVLSGAVDVSASSDGYVNVVVHPPADEFWIKIEGNYDFSDAQLDIQKLRLSTYHDPTSDVVVKYMPDDTSIYDFESVATVRISEVVHYPGDEWTHIKFLSLEENGEYNWDTALKVEVNGGVSRYSTVDARETTLEMSLLEGVTLQSPTWLGPNTEAILATWFDTQRSGIVQRQVVFVEYRCTVRELAVCRC